MSAHTVDTVEGQNFRATYDTLTLFGDDDSVLPFAAPVSREGEPINWGHAVVGMLQTVRDSLSGVTLEDCTMEIGHHLALRLYRETFLRLTHFEQAKEDGDNKTITLPVTVNLANFGRDDRALTFVIVEESRMPSPYGLTARLPARQ